MAPKDLAEGPEERRERGTALIVAGVVLWCFAGLVVFFLPAGLKVGHRATFLAIVVALAIVGLVLIISGSRGRAPA